MDWLKLFLAGGAQWRHWPLMLAGIKAEAHTGSHGAWRTPGAGAALAARAPAFSSSRGAVLQRGGARGPSEALAGPGIGAKRPPGSSL